MKSKPLLAILVAVVFLTACGKEPRQGEGILRVTPGGVDLTVSEEATRTLDLAAPDIADFTLRITNDDRSYDESWIALDQFPEKGHMLKIGDYEATALHGDMENEGFGKPCFGAQQRFTIYNEVTTKIEMDASLLNMVVTVGCTGAFLKYCEKGFGITITSAAGNEFAFGANTMQELFIAPGSFQVKVSYTRPDGSPGTDSFTVSQNTEPRKHFDITLDVNDGEVGEARIEVVFDDTMGAERREIETGETE